MKDYEFIVLSGCVGNTITLEINPPWLVERYNCLIQALKDYEHDYEEGIDYLPILKSTSKLQNAKYVKDIPKEFMNAWAWLLAAYVNTVTADHFSADEDDENFIAEYKCLGVVLGIFPPQES